MYFAEVFRQRLLYMGDCVYCVLCAVWRGIRHIRKCTTLHSFHFPHHIFFLQIHSRRRSSSSLRCSVEWRSILRYHTRFTIYTETRYREKGVGDGLRGWELCVYFENFKVFFPRVIRRRLYVCTSPMWEECHHRIGICVCGCWEQQQQQQLQKIFEYE